MCMLWLKASVGKTEPAPAFPASASHNAWELPQKRWVWWSLKPTPNYLWTECPPPHNTQNLHRPPSSPYDSSALHYQSHRAVQLWWVLQLALLWHQSLLITRLRTLQAPAMPPSPQTPHFHRGGQTAGAPVRARRAPHSPAPLTNTPGPPPRVATGPSAATARPSSSARGLIGCGSSQSAIRLRPPRERALSGRGAFNPSFRRERTAPPTRPPFSPPPSALQAVRAARSFAPSARSPAPSRRALPGVRAASPAHAHGPCWRPPCAPRHRCWPGARRPDGSSRGVSGLSVPFPGSGSFRRRSGRVRGRPSGAAGLSSAVGSRGRGLVCAADPAASVARRPGSVRRGPAEAGGARGSAASLLHRRRHERGSVRPQLADPHLPGHGGGRAARRRHAGLRVRVHRLHPPQPDPNPARSRAGGARPGPRRSGSGTGPCRPHRGPGEAAPRGAGGGAGWGGAATGGSAEGAGGSGARGEALGQGGGACGSGAVAIVAISPCCPDSRDTERGALPGWKDFGLFSCWNERASAFSLVARSWALWKRSWISFWQKAAPFREGLFLFAGLPGGFVWGCRAVTARSACGWCAEVLEAEKWENS